MALIPGTRLGPYEATALIGVGGMGEVYRATDTTLGRQVAIKILPDTFAADPERLARFEREAKTLASLNHPNIAAIYAVERSGGMTALVMELVEGDDLSQRIARGAIPLDEALLIAKQIAEALEAAHEQGIIHRDLKPANIKVRPDGTVKVLDFGLAKAMDPMGAVSPGMSQAPTITTPAMTQAGMILGTAAYMSPEQARGKTVDKRADIWAFGAVLFEMLTGTRAFEAEDVSMTLSMVLQREPDFAALPSTVPARVSQALRVCLRKDPRRRVGDIRDVRLALEGAFETVVPQAATPAVSSSTGARLVWIAATAAVVAGLAVPAVRHLLEAPPPAPPETRLEILAPDKTVFDNALLLSPDGRHLAFTTASASEGGPQIWVRSLDTLQARRVAPWTQNPVPFWSSDSRFIAFQQNGKLKKVDITGGPPTTLSDAPQSFAGGAWSQDNVVVFGNRAGGLMQVSSAGGVPTPLTTLDEKRQEISHALPSFLPDGKHFVYLRRSSNLEYAGIYIGSVGTAPGQQDATRLIAAENAAVYTPAPDPRDATRGLGFLLFLREGTLMAQPFDAAALALKGEPVPVAEQVGATTYGLGRFSASQNGGLAYTTGSTGTTPSRLIWFDRQGKNLGAIGPAGRYNSLSISPDGSRVAAEKLDGQGSDLWLIDSTSGGKNDRFTFGPGREAGPVWSPDGTQIVFAAGTPGTAYNFFRKPSNLAGDQVELFKSNEPKMLTDWSRNGKTLVFTSNSVTFDLWSMTLGTSDKDGSGKESGGKAEVFLKTDATEQYGKLSPDGRWMAYASNATGRYEIYVRPFPLSADRTGQQMVSIGGGRFPLWRRDGKELFYDRSGPSNAVMAVDVATGTAFTSGQPRELFVPPAQIVANAGSGYDWDVTADGSRFLLNVLGEGDARVPITVVLNWTMGLQK